MGRYTMRAFREFGFLVSLSVLILVCQVEGTFDEIWNLINPTTQAPAAPSTEKSFDGDDEFVSNGTQFHPTESYPYPTTPSPDEGFASWEKRQNQAEEANKYADAVLAKLKTLNETELMMLSQTLINNVGPKVLKSAMDDAAALYGLNISVTDEPYYIDQENIENSANTQQQQQPQLQPQAQATLYPSPSPTQAPTDQYDLPPEEQIFEQEHEHIIKQVQTAAPPPLQLGSLPIPLPINTQALNPVQSLFKMLTQSQNQNQTGEGSPSSPLGAVLGVFAPKPKTTTTPDPDESTEYFVVPVYPSTEPNAISKQAANLGGQVQRLVQNVGKRNISGVIDETLRIASLQTIGVVLTGFLNQLLCNPVDRWNGRCTEY